MTLVSEIKALGRWLEDINIAGVIGSTETVTSVWHFTSLRVVEYRPYLAEKANGPPFRQLEGVGVSIGIHPIRRLAIEGGKFAFDAEDARTDIKIACWLSRIKRNGVFNVEIIDC